MDDEYKSAGDGDSSESDDELDDRQFIQALRHTVRLQVDKEIFGLIESEPELLLSGKINQI